MNVAEIGATLFGLVIGWVTYRTLRYDSTEVRITDITAVVAAVGGAAVTTLFPDPRLFGFYAIGLAVGFFGYLVVGHTILKDSDWLGG